MTLGSYYFFTWRCEICQWVAEMMLLQIREDPGPSHAVPVRERDGMMICEPHERSESRPWPYRMTEDELPFLEPN